MFKWQVGQFLILLGLIGLLVFFMTDQVREPYYAFFCYGLLVLFSGIYLMWSGRGPAPPPSGRFRIFRGKGEKKADEKKK